LSWERVLAETIATHGPEDLALHLDIAPEPTEVRRAREFVRAQLAAYDNADLDVIALLLSELLTNAILHGAGSVEVDVSVHLGPAVPEGRTALDGWEPGHGTVILVAVTDASLQLPQPRPPRDLPISLMRENGLGLQIVRQLSDGWGMFRLASGNGKIVWFLVDVKASKIDDEPHSQLSGTRPPV
jgi:anti-sigma regulatory factor (Ser/Thr protein kinase)